MPQPSAGRGSVGNPPDTGGPPRVLYDGLNLTSPTGTGIATYTRSLAAASRRLGCAPELLVASNAGFDRRDPLFSTIALFDPVIASHPSPRIRLGDRLARYVGQPLGMRTSTFEGVDATLGASADALAGFGRIHAAPNVFERARLHFRRYGTPLVVKPAAAPALFHATHPTPIRVEGAANIYTVHDLIPLLLPFSTLDDKKYYLELMRSIARHADHIVTVSEHSKRDIVRVLGVDEGRVTNTYQSVAIPDAALLRDGTEVAQEIAGAFGVAPGEYYLFVGAIEPKKNLKRLVDAYAASGSRRPLLVVGAPGWLCEADMEKLREERFLSYRRDGEHIRPERSIRHLSYLPRTQLVSLMRGARALFFPSLYEGFGLPALEAMTLGTAVLAADVASLPEIVGDAAVLVDPHDEVAIARGIRSLDHDDDLVSTLVARGLERARLYSAGAYVSRLAGLYGKLGLAVGGDVHADAPGSRGA